MTEGKNTTRDYSFVPSLVLSLNLLVRSASGGTAAGPAAALLDLELLDDDEPKPGTVLV